MLLLILTLLLGSSSEAQVRPRDLALALRYRALVDAYRRGDVDPSVSGLLALNQKAVASVVVHYVKLANSGLHDDPTLDQQFFRAAAMLHTDAAFRCWGERRAMECGAPLDMARLLVDASEQRPEGQGSFRRRWYAASALVATGHLVPRDALEYFEEALEKFPDDVLLLTAAGWYSEWLADQPANPGSILGHQQTRRENQLREAARFLAAALGEDPNAREAALRLAHVESSLGEVEAAGERLKAILARDDADPSIRYLARLILGDIRERQGDAREAERLYREAVALDPIAQSARIALGRLLYAAGDATAAADVIEPFLTRAMPRDRNDPWSDYRVAYPAVGRLLLDELRTEVQR